MREADHPEASNPDAYMLALRLPILVIVLAATAVPVELRPLGDKSLIFGVDAWDVATNIAGFIPVGAVLAGIGSIRAIVVAALMTCFAEGMQLVMLHRVPSLFDVAANIAGAIIGMIVIRLIWPTTTPAIRLTRWRGIAAGTLASGLILNAWVAAGAPLNDRGLTAPGVLEAHWSLDEQHGRVASDSSGHGLNGAFTADPTRVAGKLGGAVEFNGVNSTLEAGRNTAYRLSGSMTVSAWIRPSSFPVDDAAIVSNFQHIPPSIALGWQLDTTIDRGPRTIGFKLADACTNLMARYGATPLVANTWYHITAVFDASRQSMDVYLNGVLDNGALVGTVSRMQRSSRLPLFVGRRSDGKGFEFLGTIDDVRVYSFALTADEIIADMNGQSVSGERAMALPGAVTRQAGRESGGCDWVSEPTDGRLPAAVALIGVLVSVLSLAFVPGRLLIAALASGLAGLLVFAVSAATLPFFNLWLFPLTSAAGGISVALSLRRIAGSPQ
jgi:hypothetical protein